MNLKEKALETVNSGITPIKLSYEVIEQFESEKTLLRSSLIIESLDVGVLTYKEYRFVAGRTKKGDALTQRHLEKLLTAFPNIMVAYPNTECVTFPVYAKSLVSGSVSEMLFSTLARHPDVPASRICVEISADILYEDLELVKKQIDEIRSFGVKIAVFELGDEFCPIFRLSKLPFNYAFADKFTTSKLSSDDGAEEAGSLPKFLHMNNALIFAPGLESDDQTEYAKKADFDGYGRGSKFPEFEMKEGDGDEEQ